MAISTAFSTAYTGLKTHQTALDITSNNISNASNKDYVRERVSITTLDPINSIPGDIGIGVDIKKVYRITDTFLYNRYTSTLSNSSNLNITYQHLQELSSYFPDVNDDGLNKDLKAFFDAWQNFASNPNDGGVKVDLASKSEQLATSINNLKLKLKDIQKSVNDEINTRVEEANNILEEIANLNKKIYAHEANGLSNANELRDKRDALEKRLKEIVNVDVFKSGVHSRSVDDNVSVGGDKNYSITLGGYPLLDNSTFNKLEITTEHNNSQINIRRQDSKLINITDSIKKGEIGGLLSLRGNKFDSEGNSIEGSIGELSSNLDALSKGIIRSVNSLYSSVAQEEVKGESVSKSISISPSMADKPLPLIEKYLKHPVRDGNMKFFIYNDNGDKTQEINVAIDKNKSINDILSDINNAFSANGVNYTAKLINGQIKFVDSNNKEAPNVLVKDDGSTLFSALNEIEYLPLDKVNNISLPLPLENGSFDVVVYNDNGDEVAKRNIVVNMDSKDPKYSTIEGIISQINLKNKDDNNDNDNTNDVDDYYQAEFINGKIILSKKKDENTYIGLDNDSANFGGVFGINKFFDGDSASNIALNKKLKDDPSKIRAGKTPNSGDNSVANSIVELQSKNIIFHKNGLTKEDTIFGFYREMTSTLANETENIKNKKETMDTMLKSISNQYYSLSGVNIDEELINLEKFQRGYQANAKVITTINQMLDALFGIK